MIASVNSSFLRRSGVRNAWANAVSTSRSSCGRANEPVRSDNRGDDAPRVPRARPGRCRRCSPEAQSGGGAAGRLDLLLGRRRRSAWALTCSATDDLAVAEHLDQLALADGTLGDEVLDGDRRHPRGYSSASRSRLTTWYSTRNGFLKPCSFGSRMCSGICPPSKPVGHLVAGLGALGAATGGLALGRPRHDPRGSWRSWHPGPGAGGGPSACVSLMDCQSTSSTVTRCAHGAGPCRGSRGGPP